MKCPYCEEEMDWGVVQSAKQVFWSEKKHKVFFNPNESQGDISIAPFGWNGCATPGFYCKRCRKVIIDV